MEELSAVASSVAATIASMPMQEFNIN